MKFSWINKATTILLSSVLVGGVTTTVPMFTTKHKPITMKMHQLVIKFLRMTKIALNRRFKRPVLK